MFYHMEYGPFNAPREFNYLVRMEKLLWCVCVHIIIHTYERHYTISILTIRQTVRGVRVYVYRLAVKSIVICTLRWFRGVSVNHFIYVLPFVLQYIAVQTRAEKTTTDPSMYDCAIAYLFIQRNIYSCVVHMHSARRFCHIIAFGCSFDEYRIIAAAATATTMYLHIK